MTHWDPLQQKNKLTNNIQDKHLLCNSWKLEQNFTLATATATTSGKGSYCEPKLFFFNKNCMFPHPPCTTFL